MKPSILARMSKNEFRVPTATEIAAGFDPTTTRIPVANPRAKV